MANALRYSYLRGPGGRFRNPYDHGCKRNCSDFLVKGYNEDIECHKEDPSNGEEEEGIGMIQMQQIPKLQNGNTNGNGQIAIDVNPIHHLQSAHGNMNGHSSNCSHNTSNSKHVKSKSESVPLGLGLGLGLGRNPSRPIVPP